MLEDPDAIGWFSKCNLEVAEAAHKLVEWGVKEKRSVASTNVGSRVRIGRWIKLISNPGVDATTLP